MRVPSERKTQSASLYRLSNSKLDWRAALSLLCMFKPHLHPRQPLSFKRRRSVKGLFHGHKEGSQGSGAAPQQPQSLARAGERELPFAGEFDFVTPKTHWSLVDFVSNLLRYKTFRFVHARQNAASHFSRRCRPIVSVLIASQCNLCTHARARMERQTVINHREAVK